MDLWRKDIGKANVIVSNTAKIYEKFRRKYGIEHLCPAKLKKRAVISLISVKSSDSHLRRYTDPKYSSIISMDAHLSSAVSLFLLISCR